MNGADFVCEYLVLGLRLDRLHPGLVDSFTGDRALRRAVDNEPRQHPAAPAERAAQLRRELAGTDLHPTRKRFDGGARFRTAAVA
ncbi:hypothetical protein [Saccharothrix sp. ALI-22-I]|uniref:hypothetical protein n=1 Tax=Saccharothrix sp. ALI-22-I TaxID=1933778 RepID=UPI0015C3541A|nr:hypothetical protein [Saccharothrix sp. ALI-22-I]